MKRQIGIRSMLLLTAAFAVWFAHYRNRAEIARLGPRIASMRALARELVVADEGKITVVKHDELWMDDNRWDAYLPAGEYTLSLATRGIDSNGLAPAARTVTIPAGRRQLGLEQAQVGENHRVIVTVDGERAIEVEEPKDWDPERGSLGGGLFSDVTQFGGDEPVVLFRRIFTRPDEKGRYTTPDGPAEGLLMWIERVR